MRMRRRKRENEIRHNDEIIDVIFLIVRESETDKVYSPIFH